MSAVPLISVVIPTYNRASLVCRAIDNVLEQTWENIELIVVDDGSTDDTRQRLHAYGNRIRVISQANRGPSAARNRGLESVHGDIVAFQDSDDLWKPTKLERQARLLEKLGPSVPCCLCNMDLGIIDGQKHSSFSYADMYPQYEEGLWINVAEVLATRFVFFNQAAAIRRSSLEKLGGYNETLDFLEDYDLSLRLASDGPWGVIREPLVLYGEDGDRRISQRALQDIKTFRRHESIIFECSLAVATASGDIKLARLLTSRLRRLHRQQLADMVYASDSTLGRIAANVIYQADRLQQGLYRRSVWYPKMQTVPIAPTSHFGNLTV